MEQLVLEEHVQKVLDELVVPGLRLLLVVVVVNALLVDFSLFVFHLQVLMHYLIFEIFLLRKKDQLI